MQYTGELIGVQVIELSDDLDAALDNVSAGDAFILEPGIHETPQMSAQPSITCTSLVSVVVSPSSSGETANQPTPLP